MSLDIGIHMYIYLRKLIITFNDAIQSSTSVKSFEEDSLE